MAALRARPAVAARLQLTAPGPPGTTRFPAPPGEGRPHAVPDRDRASATPADRGRPVALCPTLAEVRRARRRPVRRRRVRAAALRPLGGAPEGELRGERPCSASPRGPTNPDHTRCAAPAAATGRCPAGQDVSDDNDHVDGAPGRRRSTTDGAPGPSAVGFRPHRRSGHPLKCLLRRHNRARGSTGLDTVDRQAMRTATDQTTRKRRATGLQRLPHGLMGRPRCWSTTKPAACSSATARSTSATSCGCAGARRPGDPAGSSSARDDGELVRTSVWAGEVIALVRDGGREQEVAEMSCRSPCAFLRQDDRWRPGSPAGCRTRCARDRARARLAAGAAGPDARADRGGETLSEICGRAGFIDRDGRVDTTWLQRRAGLLRDALLETGKWPRAHRQLSDVSAGWCGRSTATPRGVGV